MTGNYREQVEVVDLLEGAREPFLIRDRSVAGHAVRLSVLLSWSHPLPHYSRLTGTAIDIPDVAQLRPKLIRLIKQRVRSHDERNLKTGGRDDLNWLLRELELTELLFDPSRRV